MIWCDGDEMRVKLLNADHVPKAHCQDPSSSSHQIFRIGKYLMGCSGVEEHCRHRKFLNIKVVEVIQVHVLVFLLQLSILSK